ncbi:MAG: nicotinate-nucleotide--dimethylbenzimidazole phosphoribosyltransferase [Candidatus Thermoplasmatota archaeon]|nr:nicotinate-nucleotide--dimethylbenzimidazole phosphoribosyltransferase [Candidatus Thermoplasmatota archaeon]
MPVKSTNASIMSLIKETSTSDMIFNLICGTTEISKIGGISAAGSNPEITLLTPTLDSEIIARGKCLSLPIPPMTPEGIPTPALITRASLTTLGIESVILDAGFKEPPRVPYFHSGIGTSRDPSKDAALPNYRVAFDAGRYIGKVLGKRYGLVALGESIPGGTTTSYLVLRSLGLNLQTSSSMPSDPRNMKEELWENVVRRADPDNLNVEEKIREYGDYVQATTLGILSALENTPALLFGGTQMATIFHLSNLLGQKVDKYLCTTSWVYNHRKETIDFLVPEKQRLVISEMTFSESAHEGLRMYNLGHVREGAGMGGSFMLAALKLGSEKRVYSEIDKLYGSFA